MVQAHRSFYFLATYLSKASSWKTFVAQSGAGSTVKWPTGLGGKEMMASQPLFNVYQAQLVMLNTLTQKQNNLAYTQLVTADGEVILLLPIVLAQQREKIDWSKSFAQRPNESKGENAWPITSTTFILVHQTQKMRLKEKEVLNFFNWA